MKIQLSLVETHALTVNELLSRLLICFKVRKSFQPDLNWRPSACEADVITTTLRKPQLTNSLLLICFVCFESI